MFNYLKNLSAKKQILWCYLIWYLVVLYRYFDGNPNLWLTSLGISFIVGFALNLNATTAQVPTGSQPNTSNFWTTFRFFLIPFCVSSFSALVKGKGFILVFSPKPIESAIAVSICLLFCLLVALIKGKQNKAAV